MSLQLAKLPPELIDRNCWTTLCDARNGLGATMFPPNPLNHYVVVNVDSLPNRTRVGSQERANCGDRTFPPFPESNSTAINQEKRQGEGNVEWKTQRSQVISNRFYIASVERLVQFFYFTCHFATAK